MGRIDKYIWCVRLSKTRSQATDIIKKGKVRINQEECKPSREVKIGDLISIIKHNAKFQFRVLDLLEKRVGPKLVEDFIKNETLPEEIEKYKLYQESQKTYRFDGTGKPNKKDRRDIHEFWENFEND